MIYNRLYKLPKVIQMEIYLTGDLTLLSDEDLPIEDLAVLWVELDEKFNQKYNKQSNNKVFSLEKEIDYQEKRHLIIQLCCEQLLFDKDEKIIALLREEGYKFDENSPEYKSQIDKINREAKGIIIKINQLKDKLPKPSEEESTEQDNPIIGVMASYSVVLGIPFDFNTCSVEAFHAYEAQVKAKIKHLESQSNKNKR